MTTPDKCPACESDPTRCACAVERVPGRCGGRWVIRGTRILVASISALLRASGHAMVLQCYPQLTAAQVEGVVRWLDAGGHAALVIERLTEVEEEALDTHGDTEDPWLAELARVCCAAPELGEEKFRATVARLADQAWQDAEAWCSRNN